MNQNNGVLVILLAAGSSRRYSNHTGNNEHELPNSEELKQLELLNGKSVISYSLETFCSCHLVDEVIVMVPPGMQARFQDVINNLAGNIKGNISGKINSKIRCIKEGGKNRFDSTHLAIAELADESGDRSVLIHDAARPLVSTQLVEKCIVALQTHPAVATALPVTDTLGQLTSLGKDTGKDTSKNTSPATSPLQTKHNREYKISKIATRSDYCLLQTPQGFQLQLLRDSFQSAANEGGDTSRWTDDCSVVLAHNPALSIHKIEGDVCNIKLTRKQDKQILESILHKQHDRSRS